MNVLWIVADDLNDYLWAEEERSTDAPNLARLAQAATRFDACYASSPLCCPSRASYMVGKTPAWTGVLNNIYERFFRQHFNGKTVVTIPEHFKTNGYFTVGINKIYHNFQQSTFDNDFDYAQPNPMLRAGSWNQYYKLQEGTPRPLDRDFLAGLGYSWGRLPETDEALLADHRAVSRALLVMESFADNPAIFAHKPLMLTVGLISPHVPHFAPARFFPDAYLPYIPGTTTVNYQSAENPDGWPLPDFGPGGSAAVLGQLPAAAQAMATTNAEHQASFDQFALAYAGFTAFSPAELRLVRMANANMAYHATIRFFDYEVGRLVDALDSLGLADNTLIVMLSDHGFSMGEHSHWAKNSLWETDLRVPLILYDPRNPVGKRIAEPVSLIDLFPTLCDLTGLPKPVVLGDSSYLDGQSLVPMMNGTGVARPVVSEIRLNGDPRLRCDVARSVLTDDWHYIELAWDPSGSCLKNNIDYVPVLYDLQRDRFEWFDVAEDPANMLVVNYLQSLLKEGSGAPVPAFTLKIIPPLGNAVSADSVLSLQVLIRSATGDSTVNIGPNMKILWQLVVQDSTFQFAGESLRLDLGALPDAFLAGADWIRVDAYLWSTTSMRLLSLDGQTLGLLHARTSGTPEVIEPLPCDVPEDQRGKFYDVYGRLVTDPRPMQLYLDACGNKRMLLH